MTDPQEQLHRTLRAHRQSLTHARQRVFAALQGHEPLTMRQLILACRQDIDRASVYRTIALFEKLSIVQRLQIGWKYKLELSDAFAQHHHHLTCTQCGRTIALPEDAALESRLQDLALALQFTPQDHQIEIRGQCRDCQQAARQQ